ncbi:hypothetical protein LEP1GSC061_0589 [Leptospira wolffii serovar Khorat str. Khorat-H2]|nr:hypothetical protein LEP1GSC061_0589 [Leptospira wolffii serovar Khorat str. Khorat-H2]
MDGETFLKKAILSGRVLSAWFLRCDQGGESFSGNLGDSLLSVVRIPLLLPLAY